MSDLSTSTCNEVDLPTANGGWADRLRGLRTRLTGQGDRAVDGLNAVVAFGVRIASAGILFVSQILLARWMGATEYGTYVYAWSLVLVLGAISTVGLNIGAIRIVSELRETSATQALRGFLRASRWLVFVTAALLTGAAIALAHKLGGQPPSAPWSILTIILLAVPAYALTDVQDGISRGWARMTSALVAPYICRPLFVLAGILVMMLLGWPLNAANAAVAAVVATWLAWLVQTIAVERDAARIAGSGERTTRAREWTRTAAPLLALGVCDLAMQNIDVIAITNLLSPAETGIYFAAAKTMALILFVHYAVGSALANRFSALSTRGDTNGLARAIRDGVRWTFWPSLVLAGAMVAAGPWVLSLFGPRFVDGYPVMAVLAVAILAKSAIGPAETILSMTGGQKDCARALMIAALANFTLCILLIPQFGIMGAACAVAIAMTLGAAMNWRAAKRNLGIDIGIWARAV
jgi:O-antigen/teichoic acid export membrane protein